MMKTTHFWNFPTSPCFGNQADEVLPGYSRKDCDHFTGNSVRHQLSWKSRAKVQPEGFRRLIFYMRNAKLYSLQFSA